MPPDNKPTPEDYALIFESNKAGARILDELVVRFGAIPSKSNGIDRVLDQFQYAGQRRVIEFIVSRINQANGVNDDEIIPVDVDE